MGLAFFILTLLCSCGIIEQNKYANTIFASILFKELNMNISLKTRLLSILLLESKTITILLGIAGLLFGLGFVFGNTTSDTYYPYTVLFNSQIWAALFIFYSLLKFIQALYKCNSHLRILNSALGMWLWSYTFIVLMVYDYKNIIPSSFILIMPFLYEIVELIIDLHHHKIAKNKVQERVCF